MRRSAAASGKRRRAGPGRSSPPGLPPGPMFVSTGGVWPGRRTYRRGGGEVRAAGKGHSMHLFSGLGGPLDQQAADHAPPGWSQQGALCGGAGDCSGSLQGAGALEALGLRGPRLQKQEAGLWTLTPPPLLPFGNMRREVNRVNQWVLAAYIRRALRGLGFREHLLWTYLPTTVDLVDHLDPALLVYHCVDEHSAFPGFVDPEV